MLATSKSFEKLQQARSRRLSPWQLSVSKLRASGSGMLESTSRGPRPSGEKDQRS